MSSDNLGFILEKLLINMVSCNIFGAEVALLGRAGNFVALSSWPAAREPPAEPLERLERKLPRIGRPPRAPSGMDR